MNTDKLYRFVKLPDEYPSTDKMVIWIEDAEEHPVWGEYREDKNFAYVVLYDSSGEEELTDPSKYSGWLEELPLSEKELRDMVEKEVKDLEPTTDFRAGANLIINLLFPVRYPAQKSDKLFPTK